MKNIQTITLVALLTLLSTIPFHEASAQKMSPVRSMEAGNGLGEVAVARDGKTVAFAVSGDERFPSQITLWDVSTGAIKKRWTSGLGEFQGFALSPDGRIAATGYDGLIRLWDARTGKLIRPLRGHSGTLIALSFSPDGSRLASSSENQTTRVWNVKTGKSSVLLRGTSRSYDAQSEFSPDGRQLLTSTESSKLMLWDASNGKLLRTFERATSPFAFARDGKTLATSSGEESGRVLKVWDVRTGKTKKSYAPPKESGNSYGASKIALSPNGTMMASYAGGGGDWGEFRLWNVATGKYKIADSQEGDGGIGFSPDGTTLIVGNWGGGIGVYKVKK